MPFTAICLHCQASKFRVPFKKRGTFATCPKCHRDFLLVPQSGADVPLMAYKSLPFEVDEGSDEQPTSEGIEPALMAEARQPPHETQQTQSLTLPGVPEPPDRDSESNTSEPVLGFALLAFVTFGLSVIATQLPYGRIVGTPFAIAGLLIAGISLMSLEKFVWVGRAGFGLNALGLLLIVAYPTWIGGTPEWTPPLDWNQPEKRTTAVGRDGSLPVAADWVNVGTSVWKQDDVQITVSLVSFEQQKKTSTRTAGVARVVRIDLTITNVGVTRPIPFVGWPVGVPNGPQLMKTSGESLPRLGNVVEESRSIYPGKSLDVSLVFEAPDTIEDLRLELPAEGFGGIDPARFRIPSSSIGGRR